MSFLASLLLCFPGSTAGLREDIRELLRKWSSEDLPSRDEASRAILSRWREWNEDDLGLLKAAAGDPDREIAGRARDAFERIDARRTMQGTKLDSIPGIEDALCLGSKQDRLALLKKAGVLWHEEKLSDPDLRVLARWAREKKWACEPGELRKVAEVPWGPHGDTRSVAPYADLVAPLLKDGAAGTRAWAAGFIGSSGAGVYAPSVAPLLKDESAAVRAAAASALGWIGGPDAPAQLAPLVDDANSTVRLRAIQSLGHLESREHRPLIARRLEDDQGDVTAAAIEVLGVLRADEYADAIASRFRAGRNHSEYVGIVALGILGCRRHAADLLPFLKDSDWGRRLEAAKALGRMGAREHAPLLVPLLTDQDLRVMWAAAEALSRLGATDQVDRIVPLLQDRRYSNRAVAARALGLLGAADQADRIVPLLDDEQWPARSDALKALGRLRAVQHREKIFRLLLDPHEYVQSPAALALAELRGSVPPEATQDWIRKLGELRSDSNRDVRHAASIAFVRLGGGDRTLHLEVLDSLAYSPGSRELRWYSLALSEIYEKDAFARLAGERDLAFPVETRQDLERLLNEAGLELRATSAFKTCGRVARGVRASAVRVLEWMFDENLPVVVLEGSEVRLMKGEEALAAWRERLGRR